jgi:hypothetical protein
LETQEVSHISPEPLPECTIVEYILSNPYQVPPDKVIKIEAEGNRQLTYKVSVLMQRVQSS